MSFLTPLSLAALLQTALHIAVILGASNFVRKLMAAGAGLCVQEKAGHTALHLACREGCQDCARWLLTSLSGHRPCEGNDACAQLDCTNYDGMETLVTHLGNTLGLLHVGPLS